MYCVLSCSVMSEFLWPHGLQPARLLCPWGFSRQEYGSGLSWPPPGDLPNPRIQPRSPTLQEDSLPYELPGKPKNTGVGSLSLLQAIFPTQDSNQGLLHCRQILYQLSYHGSPIRESKMQYLGAISKTTELSQFFFFKQTIQHHSNPYLYPNNWCRAEVDQFYEDLQQLLKLTLKKSCPFHHKGLECKSRKSRDTQINMQVWPWGTK